MHGLHGYLMNLVRDCPLTRQDPVLVSVQHLGDLDGMLVHVDEAHPVSWQQVRQLPLPHPGMMYLEPVLLAHALVQSPERLRWRILLVERHAEEPVGRDSPDLT